MKIYIWYADFTAYIIAALSVAEARELARSKMIDEEMQKDTITKDREALLSRFTREYEREIGNKEPDQILDLPCFLEYDL